MSAFSGVGVGADVGVGAGVSVGVGAGVGAQDARNRAATMQELMDNHMIRFCLCIFLLSFLVFLVLKAISKLDL